MRGRQRDFTNKYPAQRVLYLSGRRKDPHPLQFPHVRRHANGAGAGGSASRLVPLPPGNPRFLDDLIKAKDMAYLNEERNHRAREQGHSHSQSQQWNPIKHFTRDEYTALVRDMTRRVVGNTMVFDDIKAANAYAQEYEVNATDAWALWLMWCLWYRV